MAARNPPLFIHVGRGGLIKSASRSAESVLPQFFLWDEIALEITLVTDKATPPQLAPFDVVPNEDLDLRVAIGNCLAEGARKLLAQKVSFKRELLAGVARRNAFTGELTLATQAAEHCLATSEPWSDSTYAKSATDSPAMDWRR